jgi:hypothetical protein
METGAADSQVSHGSIISNGTDGRSSPSQLMYFNAFLKNAHKVPMVLRVHVEDAVRSTSVFNAADVIAAKLAMVTELNKVLIDLLTDALTTQMIRRSPIATSISDQVFTVEVLVDATKAKTHVMFQKALAALTVQGGSTQALTMTMVRQWVPLFPVTDGMQLRYSLEPKSGANLERTAHCLDLTIDQLATRIESLYATAPAGAHISTIPKAQLSQEIGAYCAYVQGIPSKPVVTIFVLDLKLLSELITLIPELGLIENSWKNTMCARPIRSLSKGDTAMVGTPEYNASGAAFAPAYSVTEKTWVGRSSCLRYAPFVRGDCHPGQAFTFKWSGYNYLEIEICTAIKIAQHSAQVGDLTAEEQVYCTVGFWQERVHALRGYDNSTQRVFVAIRFGRAAQIVFDALQDEKLECTFGDEHIRLAIGPGRCNNCQVGCFKCGKNHPATTCTSFQLPYSQQIRPCGLCRQPTGGEKYTHTFERCEKCITLNDPATHRGCAVCGHVGHNALSCSVWKDDRGEPFVPTKFTQVIQLFPTWEMTMKAVGATSPGHGSSWYNTTMVHITPVRTYADSLQGSPSPSTTSMTDTEGSGRMTRWGDGNGGDLIGVAAAINAKLDLLGEAVEAMKSHQNFQTTAMELISTASAAQTKAIDGIQRMSAKHQAFLATLMTERDKAAQLTRMDADNATAGTPVGTPPGKDLMTATGQ